MGARDVDSAMRVSELAYVLCVAAVLGFGSVYAVLGGAPPFDSVRIGPWTAWPRTGSMMIDPYARAMMARGAYLPLGLGEGLLLVATVDDAGQPLDGGCRYVVSGLVPPTRGWTLAAAGSETFFGGRAEADERSGLSDGDVVRGEDGRMTINLSAQVAGGNWLSVPRAGRFSLLLRLYDTPVSSMARELNPAMLPSIAKAGCEA